MENRTMSDNDGFPNAKARFCGTFDWNLRSFDVIEWLDTTGLAIGRNHIAKARIDLISTNSRGGIYDGFRVSVFNMKTGAPVDAKDFAFADFLNEDDRSDPRSRRDHPHYISTRSAGGFHASNTSGEFGWYIAVPSSTRGLCKAIETYIDWFDRTTDR